MQHRSDPVAQWVNEGIDVNKLRSRIRQYALIYHLDTELVDGMCELLCSPLAVHLAQQSSLNLESDLVTDAYKPKMHSLYSQLYKRISADFILNVRKSPFPVLRMAKEDPELFESLKAATGRLQALTPLTQPTIQVLQDYYNLTVSQEMLQHVNSCGVASVQWWQHEEGDDAEMLASTSGPLTATSAPESSITQLVQQYTILAQAREIRRRTGVKLDRTERLANSLAHLVQVVDALRTAPGDIKMSLFAGRRSSDRSFLLLQNLYCAKFLPGYSGTSSVYCVVKIDAALRQMGMDSLADRKKVIGPLAGTLAHEVMSVTAQLLAASDDSVLSQHDDTARPPTPKKGRRPVGLSALLSHLLSLRANGGLPGATALADTFGTRAFVLLSLTAQIPQEFAEDMADRFPDEPSIHPGARVFDIFRMWRLDSGSYEDMAEAVVSAWEARCIQVADLQLPKPGLMNSNLSSADEVLACARLPERIRPSVVAFGGLADGFLPFIPPSSSNAGEEVRLDLASIVMKAVQARHHGDDDPGRGGSSESDCASMPCAGKLGDDASKAQVDVRLPAEAQVEVKQRMQAMQDARVTEQDSEAVSVALAQMYHTVTRRHTFC